MCDPINVLDKDGISAMVIGSHISPQKNFSSFIIDIEFDNTVYHQNAPKRKKYCF
jgi:hypothetical protein